MPHLLIWMRECQEYSWYAATTCARDNSIEDHNDATPPVDLDAWATRGLKSMLPLLCVADKRIKGYAATTTAVSVPRADTAAVYLAHESITRARPNGLTRLPNRRSCSSRVPSEG